VTLDLKSRWRRLGKLDKVFALLLLLYLILLAAVPSSGFRLFFQFLVIVIGFWLALRLVRRGLRKAIWRLRNRLIVTYVLIAVVPILLIVALFGLGSYLLAGQIALYLARSELDRRVATMQTITDALSRADPSIRVETMRRTSELYRDRFPGLVQLISNKSETLRWPGDPAFAPPTQPDETSSGVAWRGARYYAWSHTVKNGTHFISAIPLSRRYLSEMVPGLGDIYFLQVSTLTAPPKKNPGGVQFTTQSSKSAISVGEQQFENVPSAHEAPGPALPAAVNQLDLEVTWPSIVRVMDWDSGEQKAALLVVHTRFSAVLQQIISQRVDELQGIVPILFLVVAIAFLVVELISLIIGISLTRTMTGAVHSLYQGTQRVMQGDFSNRIKVTGRDQLADLSSSFNTMTENLERLLAVAKEKERLQAEIEIAREVQEQLYPKTVPLLKTLSVTGLCQPARMVSGDYYDYQKLPGNMLAIAIGDVAGKGISAALLMATIQSAMRMELRASFEPAASSQAPVNGARWSTARMVSELNQQLHATSSPEKFATFFFALYDEESSQVTYTNAGHLPPILIRDGNPSILEVNGTVVGAFPFSKYEQSKIELRGGDLLLCYTDGITEPENEYGEMFGEQRLIELVTRNADRDDAQIIRTVMDAVRQWTGSPELSDDMTIVLVSKQ